MSTIQVTVLGCNAQTSSTHVLQKLRQTCLSSSGAQGKFYRPKDASRLVLYLKDINLPTPDKYDTSQVSASARLKLN